MTNIVEDIEMNNIAAKCDSIKQTVKAVEAAKVRVFILKIFGLVQSSTSFHTESTMLITNMKKISWYLVRQKSYVGEFNTKEYNLTK